MTDPTYEEHQQMRRRYGGPFNPDDLNELAAQRAVEVIAIRRYAGMAGYEKSRVRR